MNTRTLAISIAILALAAGGWWVWQTFRHARLDLVTLHVRNIPLAEVVRRMERQTGEPIALDRRLVGEITLDLTAVPLADALEQVAEQAGAVARATFAVYETPEALALLATLVQSGARPETAGWTNLSAHPAALPGNGPGPGPDLSELPEEVRDALARGEPQVRPFPPGGPGGPRTVEVTEDVFAPLPPGGDGPRPGQPTRRIVIRASAGVAGDDGGMQEFDLSPERLLFELKLMTRLGPTPPEISPSTDAPEFALRVNGQWGRLYTLEKSPFPGGLPPGLRRLFHPGPLNPEADVRRSRYEQLDRLTPEQRARP